jgi:hypothetical protein
MLLTSGYITLPHHNPFAVWGEEIAGPEHSIEGVCGPSFNGVVNDPPGQLPLVSGNK